MQEFLHFFELEMNRPTNYSWFHIMFIILVVVGTFLLCHFFKDCSEKVFKRILLIFWIVIIALEVYKEVIFSFNYHEDPLWDYPWYIFPFQMCSTPFYILPFIIFLKRNKTTLFSDAFMSYMSFYAFFAGVCVMIYPNDVFVRRIGVNIQTMVHHSSQVVLGIFISVWYRKHFDIKYFLKGVVIFVLCINVAMFLNVILHQITTETVNMFYISPYFDCTLPVLSIVYKKVPYVVFLLIYIIGFTVCAFIMYELKRLIFMLCEKHGKKQKTKNNTVNNI